MLTYTRLPRQSLVTGIGLTILCRHLLSILGTVFLIWVTNKPIRTSPSRGGLIPAVVADGVSFQHRMRGAVRPRSSAWYGGFQLPSAAFHMSSRSSTRKEGFRLRIERVSVPGGSYRVCKLRTMPVLDRSDASAPTCSIWLPFCRIMTMVVCWVISATTVQPFWVISFR